MRWLIGALLLSSPALAHTAVTSVQPGAHASVRAPTAVTVTVSEAIPLKFATFKVYPLPVGGDRLTLNRAAATLAKTVVGAKNDAAQRADLWRGGEGQRALIHVPLKPRLKAGAYALLWRFLSADGHVVSGQSVFYVK